MVIYLDTSAPGGIALTATEQVYEFGDEVDFYLSVASNLISGQPTGPSTEFTIYSRKEGPSTINVDYGTTNTTYQVKHTGYLINATVPAVGGSVNCRVVISSEPFPVTVTTITLGVSTGPQQVAPGGTRFIGGPTLITATTAVALYTVAAGFKATLLAMALQNNIVGGSNTVTVYRSYGTGPPAGNDYITGNPGLVIPASTTWYIGSGGVNASAAGNNLNIGPGVLLLTGDVLSLIEGGGGLGLTVLFELYVEPM